MCLGVSQASNTQALFKKAKELEVKYILDTKMTQVRVKKSKKRLI
jgi:formiminoglutamase